LEAVIVALSALIIGASPAAARRLFLTAELALRYLIIRFSAAFRWSDVTGGEDGLGGLKRGSMALPLMTR